MSAFQEIRSATVSLLPLPGQEEGFAAKARRSPEPNQTLIFEAAETTLEVPAVGTREISIVRGGMVAAKYPNLIREVVINPRFPATREDTVVAMMMFPATQGYDEAVPWKWGRTRETGSLAYLYGVTRGNFTRVYPSVSTKGSGPPMLMDVASFSRQGFCYRHVGKGGLAGLADFGISHLQGARNEMEVLEALNDCGGRAGIVIGYVALDKGQFLRYCQAHCPEYYQAIKGGRKLSGDLVAQVRFSDPYRLDDDFPFAGGSGLMAGGMSYSQYLLGREYQLNEGINPGSFQRHYSIPSTVSLEHLETAFGLENQQQIAAQARLFSFLTGRNFAILGKLGYAPAMELRDIGWSATVHDAERAHDQYGAKRLPDRLRSFVEFLARGSTLPIDFLIESVNIGISSVTNASAG